MEPKAPQESFVEMNNLVLPSHANALGTIFGGTLMSWMDVAGALCAMRHARKVAVTASIDTLTFLAPIHIGNLVQLKAQIVYTGKTSMMVLVDATAENPLSGKRQKCVTAYFTFVALNSKHKPTTVPPILVQTKEEKKLYQEASRRRKALLKIARKNCDKMG